MKIEKLILYQYRGVHSLSMAFHDRLNVLFGANGAGKSTVLDALAVMLSWVVNRIRSYGASGRPIQEIDITNGKHNSSIKIWASTGRDKITWELTKVKAGHPQVGRSDLIQLNEYIKKIQENISSKNEKYNLPLFVYYPVNRSVLDIPLRIRGKHSFRLLTAYDDGLTRGANFRTFFEWFREREDLENEIRKDDDYHQARIWDDPSLKKEEQVYPDRQLEAVRNALKAFLPEFKNFRVRRAPLRMEVEKAGRQLIVNQLSDGEKCLIAMIGDLARRFAIANPMSEKPLEGEGIILIDEIDLHLHPKWQRMVVPKLLEVFPNCQFVITTHSPQVLAHVQPNHLFLLTDTGSGIIAEKVAESFGKNIDRVLEDLMDTPSRPDQVKFDIHSIYEKINKGNLDSARVLIAALKNKIGDDPDLINAEVLIRRKEIIGK